MKKLFKSSYALFLCSLTIFSMFMPLFSVSAKEEKTLVRVTTDLNLRKKATTDSNIVSEIPSGAFVYVLDGDKVAGAGCSYGWLNVSYADDEGYVCSKYISYDLTDPYDRPWNSPYKAIVGGAKWISSGYISRGQYTSYLKKFNVNPDSASSMFTHQYMANLAAPSSEAANSYKAYKENDLLDLPLVFSIPIYDNMDSEYNRPGGNLADPETSNITDEEFEDELIEAGFPKSYRKLLRTLHEQHPNWTFEALDTGINFDEAVNVEMSVSSIQGSQYRLQPEVQTEKGWYLPNYATTAYYMDPRNFLTEKYILQFESLTYSKVYKEKVVESILKNSFMDGKDKIDNKEYSEIFVEAGKEANVSPVYLASLAVQEIGRKETIATSGEQFDYEGVTYSGLFNFFNIGAYSSASNPVRAGLKYASGGSCTRCGDYVPATSEEIAKEYLERDEQAKELGVTISGDYVYGFDLGTKIKNIEKDADVEVQGDYVVATGDKIKFADGNSYKIVILGDLNSDGEINSADLLQMRLYMLGKTSLTSSQQEAAKLDGKNINSASLLKLRLHLLGKEKIKQG